MKVNLKNISAYIFGAKTWIDDNWCAPDNHVAAGDPAHGGMTSDIPADFPAAFDINGTAVKTKDYEEFVVVGSSMVPKDISNGMVLLCSPISDGERNNIGSGKYLIVKVDTDYYRNKNKKASFKFKLRRSLADVPENPNFDAFLEQLKETEDSLLKESNQKALKKKFDEVYKYYPLDRPMVLSVTYRDGKIRYSFHPKDLVEFEAKYLVAKGNDGFKIREA